MNSRGFARLPLARLEPADLNEVVGHAVALYEDRLDGVQIETKLDPTMPSAMLDAEHLRRVFVNLIDNALGALADMEGERRITIATTNDTARSLLVAEVSTPDTAFGQETSSGSSNLIFQRAEPEPAWVWQLCNESFWSIAEESAPKLIIRAEQGL